MRGHGKIEGDDVGTVMAEQQRKFIPFYILRDACSVKGDQAVIMAAEPLPSFSTQTGSLHDKRSEEVRNSK